MRCHVADLPPSLPPHLLMALYRMAQELANNIVKHAQATQASLHLEVQGESLVLCAEDNGVGFAATEPEKSKGLGWQTLQDRVHLLQGTLELGGQPGTQRAWLAAARQATGPAGQHRTGTRRGRGPQSLQLFAPRAGGVAAAGRGPHQRRYCRGAAHQQAHHRNPPPAPAHQNPHQKRGCSYQAGCFGGHGAVGSRPPLVLSLWRWRGAWADKTAFSLRHAALRPSFLHGAVRWLGGAAVTQAPHYAARPEVRALEQALQATLQAGQSLVQQYQRGQIEEARTGLSTVNTYADKMEELLQSLEKAVVES
nr:hypothetical protein [Tanacetum cinerariifolium]